MTTQTLSPKTESQVRAPARAPSANTNFRAFVEGATRPSLAACAGTLVLVLVQLVLFCTVFSESFVAGLRPSALMLHEHDWRALVTVKSLALKHRDSTQSVVVCTGDSTIMAALEDPDRIGVDLASEAGPVPFEFLATGAQSLWETVIVLDQLPNDFHGVVVISVNPLRLTDSMAMLERSLDVPRLALSSDAFDREVKLAGLTPLPRYGVYLLDQSHWFALRASLVIKSLVVAVEPNVHSFMNELPVWDEDTWNDNILAVQQLQQLDRMPKRFELLERTVRRMQLRDKVRVALLNVPLNPRIVAKVAKSIDQYDLRMAELVKRTGVTYWQLADEVSLSADDYFDPGHLSNVEARRQCQHILTRRIKRLLLSEASDG